MADGRVLSSDAFEDEYGISVEALKKMNLLFRLAGVKFIQMSYGDNSYDVIVTDELENILRQEEFKKYLDIVGFEKEYETFAIFGHEHISMFKIEDKEEYERMLDKPVVLLEEEKIFVEFVPANVKAGMLFDFLLLAFRHKLKIQNADFWRWFIVRKMNQERYPNPNVFALGLFTKWSSFTDKHVEVAAANGFKKEFLEFLGYEGLLADVNLKDEEMIEFKDLIFRNIISKVLGCLSLNDFCFLFMYDEKFRQGGIYSAFKDDIKEFFRWAFKLNPKRFKKEVYGLDFQRKKFFAAYAPDEMSDYFARRMMEG